MSFSVILDCHVSPNAGNETMAPSLGCPRAPSAGPHSIEISSRQWALADVNWVLDALQNMAITTVVCRID